MRPAGWRDVRVGALTGWFSRQLADGDGQVLLSLLAMGSLTALWALFWPVPTEVVGRGVVMVPGGATLLDSRAEGQIRELRVKVGDRVRRGQVLMELDQPALEKQLERQERDLRELVQINADLNHRDAIRLQAALELRNTALSKLERERKRLRSLQDTYAQKVVDFAHLARSEVVAPLAQEVVATSDRNTALQVELDDLRIREKEVISAFTKVKLDIDSEQQQRRFRIDNTRREVRVSEARLRYEGHLSAKRDGVRAQLDSARTVLETIRLDLLKLRSSGLDTRPESSTGATQEARALSRDIVRAIEAADEVQRL